MPTVMQVGPYRFYFYASDGDEPRHVHVEWEDNVAKFWLDPVRLERIGGFNRVELNRIRRIIEENRAQMVEAWDAFFGQ